MLRPRFLLPTVVAALGLLLWFAGWFGFQCDDAFIAFRYADNWVAHGQIVYNLGERVEGYTSFTWVALLALLHRCGLSLPIAAKLLGGASALGLLVGSAQYGARLVPARPAVVVFLLALVAGNACIAAWTFGGLETPLFVALVVASLVAVWEWLDQPSPRRAVVAAATLCLATLTRPEAGILAACVGVSLLLLVFEPLRWPRGSAAGSPVAFEELRWPRGSAAGSPVAFEELRWPRGSAVWLLGYALPCGAYLLWRRNYYGDFLPNTFYVKTTGEGGALLTRGLEYLGFCASELGVAFVVAVAVLAFLPTTKVDQTSLGLRVTSQASLGLRVTSLAARLYALATVAYVARIGGDFLDLYRFLVPLFPLLFGLALRRFWLLIELASKALESRTAQTVAGVPGSRAAQTVAGVPGSRAAQTVAGVLGSRTAQAIAGALFLAWYGSHQTSLARRAMQTSEVGRREHGIEPLGWTATYARRWAATGRWLAEHSEPGDWLAVGAAGAMPFYSGLPNIDTFGLCDRTVARQGTIIGARPGHQRFATIEYLLRRAPTFLLINDYALDEPARFRRDPAWDQRGYVWVEAHVDRERYQAPTTFYHYLLVRRDRAVQLVGRRVRVAEQ